MTPPPEILLALETSGDVCSVAVLRDSRFSAEHTFRHGMHLSERLIGHIDAVLRDADSTLPDVTTFAVGIGPGSFTGTRIGVMTAKTLATVTGKPIVGVSGLDALAAEYSGLHDTLIVPILPCRTGVVFAAVFSVESATPRQIAPPDARSLPELVASLVALQPQRLLICGPATARYHVELDSLLQSEGVTVSFGSVTDPRAAQIARLALGKPPEDPIALVPHYISPPPITLPKLKG